MRTVGHQRAMGVEQPWTERDRRFMALAFEQVPAVQTV